jgi:hypothetical protein
MLLSPPTKVVVVLAASLFLAAPGRAQVPCIDVTGCSEYYYALGLIIFEVAIGPSSCAFVRTVHGPFQSTRTQRIAGLNRFVLTTHARAAAA